jgi:hypothetical protein
MREERGEFTDQVLQPGDAIINSWSLGEHKKDGG